MENNISVLITGASSGIGRALSIYLLEKGYSCLLTGRSDKKLSDIFSDLPHIQPNYVVGDLTNSDCIDKVVNKVDKIDAVIHCAGIIRLKPYKYILKSEFQEIIDVNLFSPFFLTQQLLKNNKFRQGGSIVFMSSISGSRIGSKANIMYSSSKSAIEGLVKCLALELSTKRIRVNSICAGMVKTPMWQVENNNHISNEQLALDEARYPLGYGQPEDLIALVEYLISPNSRWVTGSSIVIDGGFTIQ